MRGFNRLDARIILSRNLRKKETDSERLLWSRLRSSQIYGIKFRRQHPIENYIVDFISLDKMLVIEIDGSQHNEFVDKERTIFLESKGYKVMRFWNNEVMQNIEGVLDRIVEQLD